MITQGGIDLVITDHVEHGPKAVSEALKAELQGNALRRELFDAVRDSPLLMVDELSIADVHVIMDALVALLFPTSEDNN